MSFRFKDITGDQFTDANEFFLNGYESNSLVENYLEIDHQYVNGFSSEWYFDGIRMAYSDLNYKEAVNLQWDYDIRIELVTFQVNLEGSIFMEDSLGGFFPLFQNLQQNLFYSSGDQTDRGFLKSERSKSSVFFIQFTKEAFLRFTGDANESLSRFNDSVINRRPALLSPTNLPVTSGILNIIKSIIKCPFKGHLKKMYLLSKSIEFLVLQAEACTAAGSTKEHYLKTDYDRDRITYAREYMMGHLEDPPGLSELAKIIGVNEYKLKRGFKETFGNTVFGFLADLRLDIAKEDLILSKKTSAEIASGLGYSSPQHFSNAFKKKFGVSPNKFKG